MTSHLRKVNQNLQMEVELKGCEAFKPALTAARAQTVSRINALQSLASARDAS